MPEEIAGATVRQKIRALPARVRGRETIRRNYPRNLSIHQASRGSNLQSGPADLDGESDRVSMWSLHTDFGKRYLRAGGRVILDSMRQGKPFRDNNEGTAPPRSQSSAVD